MRTMQIFLVTENHGMYDNSCTTVHSAYETYEEAKEAADRMNSQVTAFEVAYDEFAEVITEKMEQMFKSYMSEEEPELLKAVTAVFEKEYSFDGTDASDEDYETVDRYEELYESFFRNEELYRRYITEDIVPSDKVDTFTMALEFEETMMDVPYYYVQRRPVQLELSPKKGN